MVGAVFRNWNAVGLHDHALVRKLFLFERRLARVAGDDGIRVLEHIARTEDRPEDLAPLEATLEWRAQGLLHTLWQIEHAAMNCDDEGQFPEFRHGAGDSADA